MSQIPNLAARTPVRNQFNILLDDYNRKQHDRAARLDRGESVSSTESEDSDSGVFLPGTGGRAAPIDYTPRFNREVGGRFPPLPTGEEDFRAILCNVQKQPASHDLIHNLSIVQSAGIIMLTEPNLKLAEKDTYFCDEETHATLSVTRYLKGKTTNWYRGEFFVAMKYRNINVINCYCNDNRNKEAFEKQLDQLEIYIKNCSGEIMLVGDFNSRHVQWGDVLSNTRGETLYDFIISNNLYVLNESKKCVPTFSNHRGQSVIDLVLVSSNLLNRVSLEVMDSFLPCDHYWLKIEYEKDRSEQKKNEERQEHRGWILDAKKYPNFLKECKALVAAGEEADLTPESCTNVISRACDKVFLRKNSPDVKPRVYWWTKEIGTLRTQCQKLRRKITNLRCKNRDPAAELIDFKNVKRQLVDKIRESKNNNWKALVRDLDRDPWGNLYKIVRRRLRNPKSHDEGDLSDNEIFDVIYGLFPDHGHVQWPPITVDHDFPEITEDEVRTAVNKLRMGKSPGPDFIDPIICKIFINDNVKGVTKMFNNLLKDSNFPEIWKKAKLALIPKYKPGSGEKKYRPICMTPTFSKVFEHVLAIRILDKIELSPDQFGFVKGKSTVHALKKLQDIYELHRREPAHRRRVLAAVGLDIKNAFNSLNWQDVIRALEHRRVPLYLINIMKSYLSCRFIEYRGFDIEVNSGAAQGSVLGPLLWNLVFDYVIRSKSSLRNPRITYADDVLMIFRSYDLAGLRNDSKIVTTEFARKLEKKSLTLEAEKSDAIILSTRRFKEEPIVTVVNTPVRVGTCMRYLGFYLDKGLSMSQHVREVCKKAQKVTTSFRILLPNVNGPSFLKKKLIIFSIMSIIFYGLPIWIDALSVKKNLHLVTKTLRPLKRSMCSGYRTCSNFVLDVVSGIAPTEILVKEKIKRLERIIPWDEIEREKIDEWEKIWRDEAGNFWIKTLITDFRAWVTRSHGTPNFYLTQFLSGHGCFGSYFARFKICDSNVCVFCGHGVVDTPRHTFFECDRFLLKRLDLEKLLDAPFLPETCINLMLQSKNNWNLVDKFIRDVLIVKRDVYSSKSKNNLSNFADVMPNGGPGVSTTGPV